MGIPASMHIAVGGGVHFCREGGITLVNRSEKGLFALRTIYAPRLVLGVVSLLGLVFTLIAPGAVRAQVAGGSVSGSVSVESGGVIPGASVSIRNLTTGAVRTVMTGTDGLYNLPALPAGNYEMTVSAPEFVTQVWTDISVSAGSERVLNTVLHPGKPETVVRSTAPVAPISESSACCGGSVGSSTVRNTPLNGRDWAQLANLQAGVTGVQTGSATGGGNADRGFGAPISVSGARPDQNSYRLDGISINDYSNAAPGSVLGDNLGIDAVDQVSVLGSNYPAEYGRTSGGVINAVTRSGSNSFHGDVYEFLRNSALDARNFFDGPVIPAFRRNQFGGSAGLPIQKDRTFIFGDYEGLRQSLGVTTVDTVPSRAALGVNTGPGGTLGPATLCSIPQTAQQDPPNGCTPTQIPLSGPGSAFQPDPTTHIDKSVLSFLSAFYPLPNGRLLGDGDTGIFTFAAPQVTNENYFTIRLDHKFSDRDTFYGTYMRDNSESVQPDNFDELFSNIVSAREVATLHEQHTFNSNFLNAARFGFSRSVAIIDGVSSVLDANMLDPSFAFEPGRFAGVVQSVPGITDFLGAPATPGKLPDFRNVAWNSFQGGDDIFLTRGIHALKFGVVVERMQDTQVSFYPASGIFTFDSLLHFLINQPRAFQGSATNFVPGVGIRETLFGAYVQDDIRLRKNLTFNAGLRYDMVTNPTEAHNVISNLPSLTAVAPRVGGPLFSNNPTLRNFEPRVGLAWNPRGGKTLIRSGFGIFDVLPLPYEFNQSFSREVPFVQSLVGSSLAAGDFPTNAYQQLKGVTTSGLATYVEGDPKRNYVMQWNLSVARELSSTLALTVGYVGSRGVHLPYRLDNSDMVLPTLTPAGYLFPLPSVSQTLNPNFGRIDAILYQANSFYDALQADLAKRLGHGVEFHAAYTWGKSIDTLSATESDDAFPNGLLNQLFFDQRTSRGLSDFDVGQNLVVDITWELPSPAWRSKTANWALGGWQLVGLYKASSGQPFTPILGGDPVGTKLDETGEHPDLVPGCNPIDRNFKKNPSPIYLNANCFALPMATPAIAAQCQTFGFRAPGTNGPTDPGSAGIAGTCANLWGNLGRNFLIGPGVSNLDFSAIKDNLVRRISETFNVQFRAEFFNIFNRANFASPTNNFTMFDQQGNPVADAGLLTSTQTTSRQIQFALKVIW